MSASIHTVAFGLSTITAVAAIGVLMLIALGLIGYLVHRRLTMFGSDVRRLQRDIHELKEDLRKVYAARAAVVVKEPAPPPPLPPPAPAPAPVIVDLSAIEDSLVEVRDALVELADRSREMDTEPSPPPPAPPPAPPTRSGVTIRDRIESRFRRAGFEVVRILSGDVDLEWIDGDPVRIPLEGRRRGATYKGHVMVSGDQVVDEKMTSSHEAFP